MTADAAMLTAVGNDTDFSRVFVDQLDLLGRPGDIALGISTSGASANVNRALKRARAKGLLSDRRWAHRCTYDAGFRHCMYNV